jgi:diketogulonate reductase-like aldo/keto reductase
MANVPYITLNTGDKIPAIGFGTWQINSQDEAKRAVKTALEVGYRLIDTAKAQALKKAV